MGATSLCMVDLRHLQPLAQVALLQLIDALHETLTLAVFEGITEYDTDVVRRAEDCINRRYPANRPLCFECSDPREIGHTHGDRHTHIQRLVVDEAESATADVNEGDLMEFLEVSVAAVQFYLDGHRDRHADEVAQLDAFGTFRQVEIPNRIGQCRGGAIGNRKVIDAAGSRKMALKYVTGIRHVDEFPDRNSQPYGKRTGLRGCRLLLITALQCAVAVDIGLRIDDVNRCSVFQQGKEFVPLNHIVRSFPQLVFFIGE